MKGTGKLLAHDKMTPEEIAAILEDHRWRRVQEGLAQHRAVELADDLDTLHERRLAERPVP